MAIKDIRYICEVCGLKHAELKQAETCEGKHYLVTNIESCKYDLSDFKSEFPLSVNVKLKNALGKEKIITYSRK